MNDKIQQLTDKLYQEGLAKGQAEGEQILASARAEAEKILKDARSEADAVLALARKEADALASKAESDVRMASQQALQATRKDLENLVTGSIVDAPVQEAMSDAGFLKQIITAVAGKFSSQEQGDLSLILPQSLSDQLESFAAGELASLLGKEVNVSFSKKIAGGFTIGPKDGSYFISMTDQTFKDLICEYLRPVTKKLLFG